MLAEFKNGEDLHFQSASILLPQTVTKDDKANRSLAKAVNFGLLLRVSGANLGDQPCLDPPLPVCLK